MSTVKLDVQTYLDKVYGCWLGKNIGGTLGGPLERRFGEDEMFDVWWYPELPEGGIPNDDLELQLIWLQALKERGPGLTARDLAEYWMDSVAYNFDEYGLHKTNLVRGLQPPVSGWYNNWFVHCMGSPIRSEIWACVAPAAPEIAAKYAFEDAICDHAGGESVFGEIFNAVVESCAFVIDDKFRLIDIGLSAIPADCQTHRAIERTLELYHVGTDWKQAREILKDEFYSPIAQYSPLNLAFQTVGWLWGEDFADAICKAVNCGWDTDCTGATLGSILGIILGRKGLPAKWIEPLGDEITTNVGTGGIKHLKAPTNLDQLTSEVHQMAQKVLSYWNADVQICDDAVGSPQFGEVDFSFELDWLQQYAPNKLSYDLTAVKAEVSYHETAAVSGDAPSRVTVTLRNPRPEAVNGKIKLSLPCGWAAEPIDAQFVIEPGAAKDLEFQVQAYGESIELTNQGTITVEMSNRPAVMRIPLVFVGGFRWLVSPVFAGSGLEDDCGVVESEVFTQPPAGWQELWRPDNDLGAECIFGGTPGVVYLAHFVYAKTEQITWLGVPNDNRMKVWVNGQVLHHTEKTVPLAPNEGGDGSNYAQAVLQQGWNQVLVKLERSEKPLQAHFLLSGVDLEHPINRGSALTGICRSRFPWK